MTALPHIGLFLAFAGMLTGCQPSTWNNPHALVEHEQSVLYSNFSERPKHLDPARSFSSDESNFIDQIYEPPLQYHYLKRPYQLEPATLTSMPTLSYLDKNGKKISKSTKDPAYSLYEFEIKPGIQYQPHAAFAKNTDKSFVYDFKTPQQSAAPFRLHH